MTDTAWYFKALELGKGNRLTREQLQELGVSENDPQPGFYRKRVKSGSDIPVAIWHTEMGLVALAGNDPADPFEIWSWVCSWPISEEVYRDVAENGKPWPDDPPVAEAKIGHNLPDDPHEALRLEFEAEKELAEKFLASAITTQDQADRAAVWSKKIAAIAKKATDLHKVEKQPHLDAGRAVDDKWRPLKDEPAALSTRLKRHLDVFLLDQQRKERERRESELAARQAEIHAKIAEAQADGSDASQDEINGLVKEAEKVAREPVNSQAGRTGAKVALRTFVSARVTDYEAAASALLKMNHADLKACIDQLANRAIRAGVELAGVERVEEQRAA